MSQIVPRTVAEAYLPLVVNCPWPLPHSRATGLSFFFGGFAFAGGFFGGAERLDVWRDEELGFASTRTIWMTPFLTPFRMNVLGVPSGTPKNVISWPVGSVRSICALP